MKSYFAFACTIIYSLVFSQSVFLSKVEKSHENSDKAFYRISQTENAEYLGELEILNFQAKEDIAFAQIYRKAKQIGANAFTLKNADTDFNAAYYFLSLYYIDYSKNTTEEKNTVYIFSSSKEQTIRFNGRDIKFLPRTYIKQMLNVGDEINISTKKILGSSLRMKISDEMSAQYFQIFGSKVKSATDYSGGLVFKTADIIKLDRSYGDFLRTIYTELK